MSIKITIETENELPVKISQEEKRNMINISGTSARTLEQMAKDGGLFLVSYCTRFKDTTEIVRVKRKGFGMFRIDGIGWGSDNPSANSIIEVLGKVTIQTQHENTGGNYGNA